MGVSNSHTSQGVQTLESSDLSGHMAPVLLFSTECKRWCASWRQGTTGTASAISTWLHVEGSQRGTGHHVSPGLASESPRACRGCWNHTLEQAPTCAVTGSAQQCAP